MAAESGALALGVVREVKPVMAGGVFRSASEVPLQWTVVADDETVKFEAPRLRRDCAEAPLSGRRARDRHRPDLGAISAMQAGSEVEKEAWISTLSELCKKQASAKADRKLGYAAQRRRELEERTRDAERRKAAVLATCGVSGMKHTAAAMMNRA